MYSYKHRPRNLSDINFDPNSFLTSENIWNPATRQGTYTIGNYEPANNFSASQNVIGSFLMLNHPIKSSYQCPMVLGLKMLGCFTMDKTIQEV